MDRVSSPGCSLPRTRANLAIQPLDDVMDQALSWTELGRDGAAERLAAFISGSIADGQAANAPFAHLEFDRIFPADTYATMLAAMPEATDYRPMHARSKGHDRA